jgi:dUTP pyrophosphatase
MTQAEFDIMLPNTHEYLVPSKCHVKIVPVSDRYVPKYKTDGSSCADVYACLPNSIFVRPKTRVKVPLGFAIQLPPGWELQIRGRSGHADKNGIMVTNGIGTIDSDYRGPVTVLLYNSSDEPFTIEDGDRVAQVCIQPTYRIIWDRVTELDPTERGEGGFGSTGTR